MDRTAAESVAFTAASGDERCNPSGAEDAGERPQPARQPAAIPIIQWSEQLSIGLPEVDAEHRQLIDLINELSARHQRGATEEDLRDALVELRRYSVYHFDREERLMQSPKVDPANRRTHLAAHARFVTRIESAETMISADPELVIEHLLAFLVKWLVQHVTGVDRRMAGELAAGGSVATVADLRLEDSPARKTLLDTVGDLYERVGARTFELLQAKQQLQDTVTRRSRIEGQLRLAAIVFDTMDEAVMVTDPDNLIVTVNPAFARITGYEQDEVVGKNPRMLSGRTHPPEFYQELWHSVETSGNWAGEVRNRRKNGELFVEWLSINRVRDTGGAVTHHVAVFSDVTESRVEADRIQQLAHFDLLTGLPNRALFADRARQALAKAKRDNTELAVMFLDLDKFKQINDTLGHAAGDLLLKEAAARMQACLRASDTVARIGGDEFVVLLPSIEAAANAMAVAQKMRLVLDQPFALAGQSLHISASIGISIYPGHGDDEKQLLKNADGAMYRAKVEGRNRVAFYRQEAAEGTT